MSAQTTSTTLWDDIIDEIKSQVSTEDFNTWFKGLTFHDESNDQFVLQTENSFAAIWLTDNFIGLIQRAIEKVTGLNRLIKIVEAEESAPASSLNRLEIFSDQSDTAHRNDESKLTSGSNIQGIRQKKIGNVNDNKTFKSFVVGPDNEFAHAACEAVADKPADAYNPLFLYGDTGLGKTHLMHAIAHQVHQNYPTRRVKYLSSEKFTNEFILTIQEGRFKEFREKYRKVDVLLIDDIHFLANKERIQEEFFHTFNDLFEAKKQIVLSSDRPANEIAKLESRLVSRFQMGLSVDIQPPDLETRLAILNNKADAMEMHLDPTLLEFLAKRVTRNIRRMEGALTRVASFVKLGRRSMDLPQVERLLQDILQEEARHTISIEQIQKKVSDHYHLSFKDMHSRRRPANIAFPRQIAMYLSRKLTNHSLKEIGEAFGGRDHGTVHHACQTVDDRIELEQEVRTKVEFLENQLTHAVST